MHIEVAKDGIARFAGLAPCGVFKLEDMKGLRSWCEVEAEDAGLDDETHTRDWLRATAIFLDECIEEEVQRETAQRRGEQEAKDLAAREARRERSKGPVEEAGPLAVGDLPWW